MEPSGKDDDIDASFLSSFSSTACGQEKSFLDSRGNSHMNTRTFSSKHGSTIHEGTATPIFTKGDLLGVNECSGQQHVAITVEKEYSVKVNPSEWKEIFSLCTNNKNYKKVLPKNWDDRVARFLSERIPYYSIKLYSKCSKFVAKFCFRCGIAGCSLIGTAVSDKNMILHVKNMSTSLRHIKGQVKSFRSRFVRGGVGGGGGTIGLNWVKLLQKWLS